MNSAKFCVFFLALPLLFACSRTVQKSHSTLTTNLRLPPSVVDALSRSAQKPAVKYFVRFIALCQGPRVKGLLPEQPYNLNDFEMHDCLTLYQGPKDVLLNPPQRETWHWRKILPRLETQARSSDRGFVDFTDESQLQALTTQAKLPLEAAGEYRWVFVATALPAKVQASSIHGGKESIVMLPRSIQAFPLQVPVILSRIWLDLGRAYALDLFLEGPQFVNGVLGLPKVHPVLRLAEDTTTIDHYITEPVPVVGGTDAGLSLELDIVRVHGMTGTQIASFLFRPREGAFQPLPKFPTIDLLVENAQGILATRGSGDFTTLERFTASSAQLSCSGREFPGATKWLACAGGATFIPVKLHWQGQKVISPQ